MKEWLTAELGESIAAELWAAVSFEYIGAQATVVQTFTWPSGNRTQIRSFGSSYRINDDLADRKYLEGFDGCYDNARTANRFCFSSE